LADHAALSGFWPDLGRMSGYRTVTGHGARAARAVPGRALRAARAAFLVGGSRLARRWLPAFRGADPGRATPA